MKDTIITAGLTAIALTLPDGFIDFCQHYKVDPAVALQRFINQLTVDGFYCGDCSDPEMSTAILFDFLVKSNCQLPDEPVLAKRAVSTKYLLRLNDAQFLHDNPVERAYECRLIIQGWYSELQNLTMK